jgi:hypothetical protein
MVVQAVAAVGCAAPLGTAVVDCIYISGAKQSSVTVKKQFRRLVLSDSHSV